MIAIFGDDVDYHASGTYYIRLRPDFGLYDLISERRYIYDMYAFSQTPAGAGGRVRAWQNMELGEGYLGFSNNTSYQDYRYMQLDSKATYEINVVRVPYMGSPIFYVRVMGSDSGWSARSDEHDFRSAPHARRPRSVQTLSLDP